LVIKVAFIDRGRCYPTNIIIQRYIFERESNGNKASAVQELMEDHHQVLARLDTLEIIFKNLDRKEENATKLKEQITLFKKAFWVHFDKEEQGLFPEFDNFMPHDAGPLAVMVEEHEVLRKTNDSDELSKKVVCILSGF
jgi:hemerythrin-like domain-containing protein